jgi:hypothetical protein
LTEPSNFTPISIRGSDIQPEDRIHLEGDLLDRYVPQFVQFMAVRVFDQKVVPSDWTASSELADLATRNLGL